MNYCLKTQIYLETQTTPYKNCFMYTLVRTKVVKHPYMNKFCSTSCYLTITILEILTDLMRWSTMRKKVGVVRSHMISSRKLPRSPSYHTFLKSTYT